jgi:hypothetical protein
MRGATSPGETLKLKKLSLLAGLDRLVSMFAAISPVLSLRIHHGVVTMDCSLKGSWMTALSQGEKEKKEKMGLPHGA